MFANEINLKVSNQIASLRTKLRSIDSIELMNSLNRKLIESVNPPFAINDLPTDYLPKFNFLFGLISSSVLLEDDTISRDSDPYNQVIGDVESIFVEYVNLWLMYVNTKDPNINNDELVKGKFAYITSILQSKLGNSDQFNKFGLEMFSHFDESFFIPKLGIGSKICTDIFISLIKRIEDKYNDAIENYRSAILPLMKLHKNYVDGSMTLDECRARCNDDAAFANVKDNLCRNATKIRNAFIVTKVELISDFRQDYLDAFFQYFSKKPGVVNKDYNYPTDFNELTIFPLLEIKSGQYYVTCISTLSKTVTNAFEMEIANSSYCGAFLKHRDKLSQKWAVESLREVFCLHNIIEEAHYKYKEQRFETDILILYKKTLIICEVKSKALRDLIKTQGNVAKIKGDFEPSIQKAYEQARRVKEYVLSNHQAIFYDKKGRFKCRICSDEINEYLLMVITSESFGVFATDLSMLLNKKNEESYPLAICLFDLQLLISILNKPDKFCQYFRQRIKLHGYVHSHDELDYAGYFITHGNLNFKKQLENADMIFLDPHYCSVFDEKWFQSKGIKYNTNINSKGPFYTTIERRGTEVTIGVEGKPDSYETFKIADDSIENNKIKLKGRVKRPPWKLDRE